MRIAGIHALRISKGSDRTTAYLGDGFCFDIPDRLVASVFPRKHAMIWPDRVNSWCHAIISPPAPEFPSKSRGFSWILQRCDVQIFVPRSSLARKNQENGSCLSSKWVLESSRLSNR